ncbi:MAG TPA: hypothetical protein DD782_07650 [Firmicutes bacterium]|jgi:DNA-binding MarR family transcriptional regulator|nr:hypothetical protein [Bacillota bacterium]
MNPNLKKEFVNLMFRLKKIRIAQLPGVNLHMGELFVMRKIAAHPFNSDANSEANVDMTDIQNSLCVTKPAVSQMFNALEKKGYISREIDPRDRRRFITNLTPAGEQITVAMKEHADKAITQTIARFGEENMTQLINLFNQFIDIIEDAQNEFLSAEAEGVDGIDKVEGAESHD